MTTSLTIGLLGCGKQAPKHISGFRQLDGVDVVVADVNPSRSRKVAQEEGVLRVEDPGEIFRDDLIDAVDICTPTPTHAELVHQALKAGKHFLCEKPLTPNLSEAREIERALSATDLVGMVGYLYRYVPAFRWTRQILDGAEVSGRSDVLGRIVYANLRIGGRGSHRAWKHRKASGGGAIREMLVHMLDLALWYFGYPERVEVLARDLLRPKREIGGEMKAVDAEDYVMVRMRSRSGVPIICQADLVTPAFTQYVEIQGERGTLMASIQERIPSFLYCTEPSDGWPTGMNDIDEGESNLFTTQAEAFVEAVENGRRPTVNSVEDSIRLMEVLQMIEGTAE